MHGTILPSVSGQGMSQNGLIDLFLNAQGNLAMKGGEPMTTLGQGPREACHWNYLKSHLHVYIESKFTAEESQTCMSGDY